MSLEFEKPILALEQKLEEMRKLSSDVKLSSSISSLKKEIDHLKRETFKKLTRWQRVQLSRHPDRPYTLDYIPRISKSFIALHGDQYYGDDKAIVGGFAAMDGKTFMIIGHQKGRNTKERQYRNFGMANPEGYRKATRLMKLAEKFNKPIAVLIDTPGAYPGIEAEERGQAEAIASSMREMITLKVPVVCVVIGEGASGGAIAIGVGDRVAMMENTWYSVISPESCSSILWRSWDYKEQAAEMLKPTAVDMLAHKMIDDIIQEPLGGAHRDVEAAAKYLKDYLLAQVAVLSQYSAEERIKKRMARINSIGVYKE